MKKELVVIGIGSSAGGLEALQILLSQLPDIPNCAYIIAQHLSPTHKSMMVELLTRVTNIPVLEIKNGMVIKAKTIYMTPENSDLFIQGGKIYLKTIEQSFGPRPSVNYFFNSLAQDFAHRAIGIILSGTGSDGAYGIRSIKAQGGITIAQSPQSAKYDGMPLSAINTGKVDLVISIDNLAQEIQRIVSKIGANLAIDDNERLLQQIHKILFEEYGVDFALYKKNTVIRRLERRIAALKLDSIQEYFDKFENNKEEISSLYHDILIGVTSFFRDKDAFEVLKNQINYLISKKEQGEEIRFWSIGCSTGEEAYTIAIMLSEILGERLDKYKIKIFATDIDDEALQIARTGIYAETSFQELDKEIIQKYFSIQKNHFEVKKKLRELVIFSRHNVVSDSPFLRLDLVVCRNMLIYFSQALQNRFFPIIHYALKDNGLLFLGKSESVGSHIDLFHLIDKNAKLFKAQYRGPKEPPKLYNYAAPFKPYEQPHFEKSKNEETLLEEHIIEALSQTVLDKCVVINSSNDMIYLKGKNPYISHQSGRVSNNIFKSIEPDLALDLRSAINEANKSKQKQQTPFRAIKLFDDIIKYVRVVVVPVEDYKSEAWFNILFFQSEEPQNIRGHIVLDHDENSVVEKLTMELDSTKSHLQNVIEELETSYEEMQSLNEELQSSNEELQSSNEELETTNEELQSTNEELQTAYSELRLLYEDKDKRTQQLEALTQKLQLKSEDLRKQQAIKEAILDTTPIAVTMVDTNGHITYANKAAQGIFELDVSDLTQRQYNSPDWKIRDYNGGEFAIEKLPFSLIKRTFAPVYNIQHTIETEEKRKFLSISGAPLFDLQGLFQGAVFSIEDKTHTRQLKDDIIRYQSVQQDPRIDTTPHYDLMRLALIDNMVSFKNHLNSLSLLYQTIDTEHIERSIEQINSYLESVASSIESRFDLYTQKLYYEKSYLHDEIIYHLELFISLLQSHKIDCHYDNTHLCMKPIATQTIRYTLYHLFVLLITLQKQSNKPQRVTLFHPQESCELSLKIDAAINFNKSIKSFDIFKDTIKQAGHQIVIKAPNEFAIEFKESL
ncbi:MAG: PAS domain-containing protein [Campylobacterales bacterium]|nr:PAS domain-containing protein [Campylobacterales bacterium]